MTDFIVTKKGTNTKGNYWCSGYYVVSGFRVQGLITPDDDATFDAITEGSIVKLPIAAIKA